MLNFKKHTGVCNFDYNYEKMCMRNKFKRMLYLSVLIRVETTGGFPLFCKWTAIFCCFLCLNLEENQKLMH